VANLSSAFSIIGQAATIALIVFVTRWVVLAKGAQLPRTSNGTSLYGIKWQWRGIALVAGAFSIVLLIGLWREKHSPPWTSIVLSVVFVLMGLSVGSGTITTDQSAITKKVFWHTRSFRWGDITEIRLHKKDGGAIDLRAGRQKLIIDARFVAQQHLLTEILARTKLQPIGALPRGKAKS
jgi:hypothetical protein